MPAADGVDDRARRVAARLLASRSRRSGAARAARGDAAVRGHPGAPRLAKVLRLLEVEGWVSLAQVKRPGAPEGPPIDHLVIGPGGVVVVDSAAWAGRVEVSRGVLQQNGVRRERETTAVAQAAGGIAALLLPQHRTAVHAFVCVLQHDLGEQIVAPGVHVVGVSGLARALRSLPHRLHPAEVLHLNTVLRQTLVEGEGPEQLTTAEFDTGQVSVPTGGAGHPGTGSREPDPQHLAPGAGRRSAARSAGRRQRARRPWWHSSRVLLPRLLLAVLLLGAGVALGPGVVRTFSDAVGGAAVVTVLPSGAGDAGAPDGDAGPIRTVVPPMWSGGSAPVQPIPPAVTAHEEPLGSLAPVQRAGHTSPPGPTEGTAPHL
ncbi:MAG TPA: NERD domain-containing protein [Kineosporiaceae bacterium]